MTEVQIEPNKALRDAIVEMEDEIHRATRFVRVIEIIAQSGAVDGLNGPDIDVLNDMTIIVRDALSRVLENWETAFKMTNRSQCS